MRRRCLIFVALFHGCFCAQVRTKAAKVRTSGLSSDSGGMAMAIVRYAGGSSGRTTTLWLSERSTSSCTMQMPSPLSTMEIMA